MIGTTPIDQIIRSDACATQGLPALSSSAPRSGPSDGCAAQRVLSLVHTRPLPCDYVGAASLGGPGVASETMLDNGPYGKKYNKYTTTLGVFSIFFLLRPKPYFTQL